MAGGPTLAASVQLSGIRRADVSERGRGAGTGIKPPAPVRRGILDATEFVCCLFALGSFATALRLRRLVRFLLRFLLQCGGGLGRVQSNRFAGLRGEVVSRRGRNQRIGTIEERVAAR